VETWASGVLDARGLRQGAKGNIFVSSLFVANKVYVIPEQGNHQPKVIIDKMPMATGIEFHNGSLYLRRARRSCVHDVEDKLDNLGEPKVLYDKLPGGNDHSWKYCASATTSCTTHRRACNICDPGRTRRSTA